MKEELLASQYKFRRDPSNYAQYELAILILKPGFTVKHMDEVYSFVNTKQLTLMSNADYQFDLTSTLALYNDIFRFSDNDILFGYEWKKRKLTYMISGPSHIFIVQGRNAQVLSETFKYEMRDTYSKLSIPNRKLTADEFEELAIKNVIHVVDGGETEAALWLVA